LKIAVIDKAPSKNDYSKWFDFDFDLHHMSEVPIAKLLKKDVTLNIDLNNYDFVILVGSEAAKEYAKVTSVTKVTGVLIDNKFICISNPAMLYFKPEGKPDFQRAVDRIHKYITGELKAAQVTGDFKGIQDKDEAVAFLNEVLESNVEVVALDTETTALYPRDGYVIGISISYKLNHGRYIDADIFDDDCVALLQQIVNKYRIVFHNMKFDYKMLEYHQGIDFSKTQVEDTMLLHYVLDENDQHGLKYLAAKFTEYGNYEAELDEFKKEYCKANGIKQEDFTYDLIPFDIISEYASMDTAVTLEIYFKLRPPVAKNPKLENVYTNILIPGTLFIHNMEEVGIPINVSRMSAADIYLESKISAAKEKLYSFEAVAKYEHDTHNIFNPNSVYHIRSVLFDYLKLTPTGKLTATKAISVDAEVLEELAKEHPLPAALLDIRKLTKMRNTYVSKILPEIDRDGRIRTNFNISFTTSGRLSSSGKFNAQQITRDDPIIKACIYAPDGYVIVSQDLFQVPLTSNSEVNIPLIAGNPLSSDNYKVASNSKLECLKILEIGQSAAKLPISKEERSETIRKE
jgi:hypothetical protein